MSLLKNKKKFISFLSSCMYVQKGMERGGFFFFFFGANIFYARNKEAVN